MPVATWIFYFRYRAGEKMIAFETVDSRDTAEILATLLFWKITGYEGVYPFSEDFEGTCMLERVGDLQVSHLVLSAQ